MLRKLGPVKFNFKHFLFSSTNSENDQKYEYLRLLDKNMLLFTDVTYCSDEFSLKSKDIILHKSVKILIFLVIFRIQIQVTRFQTPRNQSF